MIDHYAPLSLTVRSHYHIFHSLARIVRHFFADLTGRWVSLPGFLRHLLARAERVQRGGQNFNEGAALHGDDGKTLGKPWRTMIDGGFDGEFDGYFMVE